VPHFRKFAMNMHLVYLYTGPCLWTAFAIYMITTVGSQESNVRRESWASWAGHMVPIAVTFLLIGLPRMPGGFLTQRFIPWHPANFWIGTLLVILGLSLVIYARICLKSNWSATITVKQGHELIRTGPYRWVRHPFYTGLLLAFMGSALTRGEWRGILAVVIAYVALWRKLRKEERYMTETFGEQYHQYQLEVPALIPKKLG
jgi:protein-S-isoprenylcysteine O-methyltransferase Ste14